MWGLLCKLRTIFCQQNAVNPSTDQRLLRNLKIQVQLWTLNLMGILFLVMRESVKDSLWKLMQQILK